MDDYLNMIEIVNQSSEINGETNSKNSLTKISIKGKGHYMCKECETFHLIKIIDKKTIKIICKEREIDSNDFFSNIPNEENLDKYQFCQLHNENKKIGICSECKRDLCLECINLEDCKNKGSHTFVDFNTKNDEIAYKEKFISDFYDEKVGYNKKTKRGTFNESEKKSEQNISEENKYLQIENNNQELKVSQEKNLSEFLDITSLKDIFDIIKKSKEKMPSYNHYENIINIYHFLCDKLELKYYSFSNNQAKIRLFGEKFIKNNKNKCSVMINNQLKK